MESLQNLENKYFYKVYGLNICSDIEIEELVKIQVSNIDEVDIFIKLSDMPKHIIDNISVGKEAYFSEKEVYFTIKDIAIYRIVNGDTIYVQSLGGSKKDIKCFILGSSFGALLIQRDIVAIHGGSVLANKKLFTITGDSGAGKSTLVSGFRLAGYKFLSDDVSRIKYENNIVKISPAYPQQKLCKDAVNKFNLNINELVCLDEGRDKYAIPSKDAFLYEDVVLDGLIEIVKDSQTKDVYLEEVKGISKMQILYKNIYRYEFLRSFGEKKVYHSTVIKIASKTKIYRLHRPDGDFTIDKQIERILEI